jgi:hypothetical protein
LFPRSGGFRRLFHAAYADILALCLDNKCAPKPLFQELRASFRQHVLAWCEQFAGSEGHVGRLRNSISYINAKVCLHFIFTYYYLFIYLFIYFIIF